VLTQGAFLDYDLNEESKAVRVYYRRHPVLGVCREVVCYWHTTREQRSMAIIDVRNPVCKEADCGQRH
jgi:hypothetical protein